MKKIFAILAVAAVVAVNAQAQNADVAKAKAALEKAQAGVENAKQNTKTATWIKYAEALVKAYEAPKGNAILGMNAQEFQLLSANERPLSEAQVEIAGQVMTKRSFATRNVYFNQAGALCAVEVTEPILPDALDKAIEAYAKAAELDEKGQKTAAIKEALQNIDSKLVEDASCAYTIGKYADASALFELANKALSTKPSNAIDTTSLYNAGLTAWMANDLPRAKDLFGNVLNLGYYGTEGDIYAKLADIAEKLGDKEASKNCLSEGSKKFPQSQSLLIGLINYYISSGEDTAQLFDLFAEAQKNEPNNASLFYVEGNARAKLGQNEEALAAYDKAIEVNPNYEWGYIGKGMHLYNMAVEVSKKADEEYNDAKYQALLGEFEQYLKGCVAPFEKAFEMVNDVEIKKSIAEYLKQACFRFRSDPEFQAKHEKYAAFADAE